MAFYELSLVEAVRGLCAYSLGATDAGIRDEALRGKVLRALAAMNEAERSALIDEIHQAMQNDPDYDAQDVQIGVEEAEDWIGHELSAWDILQSLYPDSL